jgi:hypothetical protein
MKDTRTRFACRMLDRQIDFQQLWVEYVIFTPDPVVVIDRPALRGGYIRMSKNYLLRPPILFWRPVPTAVAQRRRIHCE